LLLLSLLISLASLLSPLLCHTLSLLIPSCKIV
jgi:hypothetical protein